MYSLGSHANKCCDVYFDECWFVPVLTPAHFFTETVPDRYNDQGCPVYPSTYWTLVQTIHRSFWTRFQNEYLQALNHMNKWSKTHANIQVGNLVAIKDEGLDKKLIMLRPCILEMTSWLE